MKRLLIVTGLVCAFSASVSAQLSAPKAEAVYGGSINAITAIPLTSTTSRVFISTQSANSIFCADMTTGDTSAPAFDKFIVMPGAGASGSFGGSITQIAAHEATGDLYFVAQMGTLEKTNPSGNQVTTIENGGVGTVSILNISDSLSYTFFNDATGLRYATLDSTGKITDGKYSPLKISGPPQNSLSGYAICVSPSSKLLYMAILPFINNQDTAAAPILYATSDKYDSFSSSTSLSTVNTSPLASDSAHWTAFAIGNDGTLFFGGHSSFQQIVAYSKDGGKTWTIDSTHFTGMTGPNFAFSKTGNTYTVYFTTIYAAYDSSTGFSSWSQFGNAGLETHPNDGSVCIDPLNNNVVYMTTDQGLGASVNGGSVIKEIDDGITALQINGLVLDSTKTNGWVASKAGLRHVTDYSSSPVWSVPIFPNSDGAPYYSVALIGRDANSVYVGNNRVYRTTDGGSTWTMVFDAENPPYNFNEFTYPLLVDAINVNPYDTNMVIAGYTMQNGESQAGAFYSTDGGTNWSQLLCLSASIGEDVNATSLIFTHENDSSVAYIGVRYDSLISNAAARGRSIYRAVWNGDSWSVRQDMSSSYTSTHTDITASIYAMALSSSTDTLYAAGSDESGSNVKIYYKVLGGPDLWTELPTTGISTHAGNPAIASSNEIKAMAIGNDTLYCAIDNNIFIKDISSDTSWTLGCAYGVGDAINALYYDDLLVGTGTGLYGQHIAAPSTAVKNKSTLPDKYVLYQNYPDPFNPTTVINYQLPVVSNVTLSVYDILGRKVATLINAKQNAGVHIAVFDGASYSSGVYFYRIETNGSSETKKMLLLK